MDITKQIAFITGGSRGIGRAIAIRLAQAGADIAMNYLRNRAAAEETAKIIEDTGSRCLLLKGNVAEVEKIPAMYECIQKEYGKLDILISNAASGVIKPALELTRRHWSWTLDINAGAFLPLVQHAVPLMKNGGKIIAVSSLGAVRAIPQYAAVGSSKAALESLARHLAVELAPKNINVNVISAGIVETDALSHFPHKDELLESSRIKTPAGRLVTPDDVADVALFLCSPMAKMIYGQTIVVDGGYSIMA
ncbi:MAG: enoyl-[acyl-carrier-protein] reductase FabL [bacterium]|nr:enoyl-[acyl-carrier-protein] reductase FabL [bacterium]